jgi:diguanylate cyclase (GGDEF)-like protein
MDVASPLSVSTQALSSGAASAATSIPLADGVHDCPLNSLVVTEGLDLIGDVSTAEETAYVWDLRTDHIDWESNAQEILGVASQTDIATGQAYHRYIAAEHSNLRRDAIWNAHSDEVIRGVPYRLQYRFVTGGPRGDLTLNLEDQGRWWPGADGRPERARGVVRIVANKEIQEQQLGFTSDFDELTGQLNRIRLTEALGTMMQRSEDERLQCGFMMVAVNNLAVINETFGFDVGDEAISAVGRQIKDKLRGGDVIGRYASNKFGVVMQDCGPGAMRIAAERFMKAVRDMTIRTSACQITVTVSIGGVIVPTQAHAVPEAINCALRALEKAKTKRFDCFMPFETSLSGSLQRTRSRVIADNVIDAIDEKRMRLALQPMVGAKSGKPEIYECLLRMEQSDGSLISAGEFIPIAEQLGLSRLIDRRTLELSVDLLRRHPELVLSLNVSSLTCSDHEWLTALRRLTNSRRDILKRIVVEITETAAIQDLDQSINFVDCLKELGCRVAIDDFGAGYTSFKNLKLMNVDMIKIDGAFVKNLVNDTSDQVFIRTMIELAQTFGMETVAEWVGDDRCVQHLTQAGITYLQGFHYGFPIDAADYKSPR